jgi:hypothetical protein
MASKSQSLMFGQVNSAFADRLQSRAIRRAMVLALFASAALVGVGIAGIGDRFWWMIIVTVPFWIVAALLNLSLRGIFELNDELLDEHQIAVRNASYKSAYGYALVFLVIVATVATGLALERRYAFAVAAFAFLTGALAPRLVAAWSLEDSDDRE